VINIQVRRERGDIVERGDCRLNWSDVQRIDQDQFPYLGSLLPYADTMFNSRQTSRIRLELEERRIREVLGKEAVAEIGRLCRYVESGSHLYLWFLGD
jgi:hypothetical protein